MNSEHFFGIIRENLFGGKMTHGVVDTLRVILDTYYAEVGGRGKAEHLAYVLATAYHESYSKKYNPEWLPVREGFANTNAGAIASVTMLHRQGKISTNYAKVQPNGHSYYGRGFVQITWPENYRKLGKRLGIDLYADPDLALGRPVAAKLLVIGMLEGLYTGRALHHYDLVGGGFDAFGARRIINGTDKAGTIYGYYEIFLTAVKAAINN